MPKWTVHRYAHLNADQVSWIVVSLRSPYVAFSDIVEMAQERGEYCDKDFHIRWNPATEDYELLLIEGMRYNV